MAFIDKPSEGAIYQPGWFLAHEECTRITKTFHQNGNNGSASDITVKTAPNGGKYVPMGSVYKEKGAAVGIVYEDVDVTVGDMPGSVVTAGTVYKDRCAAEADTTLEAVTTITFIEKAPAVTRPDFSAKKA